MHDPPGTEALLELVRHDAVSRPSDRLRDLLGTETARAGLQALAARHSVMGPVLRGLRAAAARDEVLAAQCRALLAQYPVIVKQAAMWDLEIDRLLRLLGDAGLTPVTLKGAALRASVYRDSVERSFGDVDFLLPRSELDRAIAVLETVGYSLGDGDKVVRAAEQHFHHRLANRMGFQVEVHWGLVQPDAEIRLDPERVLSRSRVLERPGAPPMRIPSPEDMILHLATQETEDWFSTIRRLVDLDRVLRGTAGIDWDYLRSAAVESRAGPLLAFTLQLARRLIAAPIPPGFISSLGLSRAARINLALLAPEQFVLTSHSVRRPTSVRILALCLSPDAGARRRLLREMATGRFDSFSLSRPEVSGGPVRALIGFTKLAVLWAGLYLRRGVAAIPQSALGRRGFWREDA